MFANLTSRLEQSDVLVTAVRCSIFRICEALVQTFRTCCACEWSVSHAINV